MINCKESFLNDIVQVDIYADNDPSFDIPANVMYIYNFVIDFLPEPLLRISYNEDGDNKVMARENAITIKQTIQRKGSSATYIYDVSATLEDKSNIINRIFPELLNRNCNIIVTTADGERLLIYSLPNTFSFTKADTNNKEVSIKLGAKAINDYIPVTVSS